MISTTRKVAVLVGSLRKGAYSRLTANALAALAPPSLQLHIVEIGQMPLYNQDDEAAVPASWAAFRAEIKAADAVLFVTPEYNRSVPGVLKNAIDNASRPYGANAFAGKAAGVIGVSVGAIGTAMAQQHLRNILAYLDAPTLGQPEAFIQAKEGLFDAHGEIGPANRQFLQNWMDSYVAWVKKQAG